MSADREQGETPAMSRRMRQVSRGLSALALVLMVLGFVLTIVSGPRPVDPRSFDLGVRGERIMLDGVVVLCLLPGVRVLTAGAHYAAARRLAASVVALIVLLELVASIVTGG